MNDKTRITDQVPPVVTIASPQDGSPYSSAIEVRGTARDYADTAGAPGRVVALSYQVQATPVAGTAGVAPDGSFDFTFLASSLHGAITVTLTATDWNGNKSQTSVGLVDSGNGIPAFTAVAASGSVTLTWSPVPLVDHYELYYETSDTMPSPQFSQKISPVTSGYSMTGLANGHVYAFLLESVPLAGSGAAANWSTVQKVIPLSQDQLVPVLVPGHDSIQVTWTPIAASVSYQVWKGTSALPGSFVNVSGTIQGSSFVDSSVQVGQTYYYAIRPDQYSQVMSWPTAATPDPFPASSRREIGSTTTHGAVSSPVTSADGKYLYLVDAQDGIVIYDVSSPAMPVRLGNLPPIAQNVYAPGTGTIVVPFTGCAVYSSQYIVGISAVDDGNNVLYGRVSLIDVSNPSSPQEVAFYNTGSAPPNDWFPTGLAISGNLVFTSEFSWDNANARLQDFAISGSTLTLKSAATIAANGNLNLPLAVNTTTSNTLYVTNGTGIQIVSFNPSTGVFGAPASYTTGLSDQNSAIRFLASGGRYYAYVGNWTGFRIIDVTSTPSTVSTWTTPSSVNDIELFGGRAYLSTSRSGLLIYDISAPLSPGIAGTYPVTPVTVGSAIVGNALFLALGYPSCGFKTLDVSIPRPTFAGASPGSGYLINAAVSDRYAYAAAYVSFDIYDLNAGAAPVKVATINTQANGGSSAIAVSGSLLITGNTGFAVYDLSNPTAPTLLSAPIPVPTYMLDVKVRGSLAYVACRDFGLKIFDISTPAAPKELGSLPLGGSSENVSVFGSYAYVAHNNSSLAVADVTDSLSPRLMSDITIPGASNFARGSAQVGSLLYLCLGGGLGGLTIYDVSSPLSPVLKGQLAPPSSLQGYEFVAVQDEYAYAARDDHVLALINVANPAAPSLVSTLSSGLSPQEALETVLVRGAQVFAVSQGPTWYGGLLGYTTR